MSNEDAPEYRVFPSPPYIEGMRRQFSNVAASFGFQERLRALSYRLRTVFPGYQDVFSSRKAVWLKEAREELGQGNISPLIFSMMTSALVHRHMDSGLNRTDYLRRIVSFYNAQTVDELMANEAALRQRGADERVRQVARSGRLSFAKVSLLFDDIEIGTQGRVTACELHRSCQTYLTQRPMGYSEKKRVEPAGTDGGHRRTYSAFPKHILYPLIRDLKKEGKIDERQVCLIFGLNFHSLEHRRNGHHYLEHVMGVAQNVINFADLFGLTERERDLSLMAALVHDIGEKSNFDMDKDFDGLVSKSLARIASHLNKLDGESYYHHYIGGKCVSSRVEAFVKLCDIYHNMSDCNYAVPSFKQAYVYPIAANYLRYMLTHGMPKLSIEDYVERQGICSREQFSHISYLADNNRKIAVSEVAVKIPSLRNIIPVKNIFDEQPRKVNLHYAHLSRAKGPAVRSPVYV